MHFFLCRPFNELLNDLRNGTLLGMDSYMIKMAFCCMKYFWSGCLCLNDVIYLEAPDFEFIFWK